jgi:hypothetical protein
LREVSIRIEAEAWRRKQDHRLALEQAWFVAALGGWKKVPKLKKFMRDAFPDGKLPQTADEVASALRAWAQENKITIRRHRKKVR